MYSKFTFGFVMYGHTHFIGLRKKNEDVGFDPLSHFSKPLDQHFGDLFINFKILNNII